MIRLQNPIRFLLIPAVMIVLLASAMSAQAQSKAFVAKGRGFNDLVSHLEKNYRAKRTKVPMLGLANFAIRIVRPAGVKGFKLAVFEDQDFSSRAETTSFHQVMRQSYNKDWSPLVQINSKRDGNSRTFIYVKQSKKDIEFAMVTIEEREAVLLQVKFNPDAASRFLENPRIMGISLGNSIRGNGNVMANQPNGQMKGRPNRTAVATPQDSSAGASDKAVVQNNEATTDNGTAQRASRPVLNSSANDENNPPLPGSTSATANPAEPVEVKPAAPREDTVRIETRLVNLNVKAMDRAGQPITNLKQGDFDVYEDGVKQDVSHFKPVTAPVSVVMLLDLSGSTQRKRKAMKAAAIRFVDAMPAGDKIAMVGFTRRYKVLTDFTDDKATLKSVLEKINGLDGGTAFYDSMWKALDQLDQLTEARKAIVVLTDGEDESLIGDRETTHTYDALLDRASEEDVTIYPIYFSGTQNHYNKLGVLFGGGGFLGENKSKTARKQLEQLADQTGGELFSAQREEELEAAYKRVASELHTLYSLAYSPDKLKHDGQFRRVSVKLKQDSSVAKTRRGYFDK
ncbi:MAG: VWA domain-containing protein [Blastocatellia bacterium]